MTSKLVDLRLLYTSTVHITEHSETLLDKISDLRKTEEHPPVVKYGTGWILDAQGWLTDPMPELENLPDDEYPMDIQKAVCLAVETDHRWILFHENAPRYLSLDVYK